MNFKPSLYPQGLTVDEVERAFSEVRAMYGDFYIENGKRSRLLVAVSFMKGKKLLDIGSFVNIYPPVLSSLGMNVTVLDNFRQRRDIIEQKRIDFALENVYSKLNIEVIEEDVFSFDFTKLTEQYDVITSFEVFEHLIDSPKPIMSGIYKALRPGGYFVLSVPNIAALLKRIKLLAGYSPLPRFERYYKNGNPFTGHRRELTPAEACWMVEDAGLKVEKCFGTNLYGTHKPRRITRLVRKFQILPGLMSYCFVIARKPDNPEKP